MVWDTGWGVEVKLLLLGGESCKVWKFQPVKLDVVLIYQPRYLGT